MISFLSRVNMMQKCHFSIHAGQGGTEAMDWTNMLYRMYSRFLWSAGSGLHRYWNTSAGEEAGVKSVTIKITGHYGLRLP